MTARVSLPSTRTSFTAKSRLAAMLRKVQTPLDRMILDVLAEIEAQWRKDTDQKRKLLDKEDVEVEGLLHLCNAWSWVLPFRAASDGPWMEMALRTSVAVTELLSTPPFTMSMAPCGDTCPRRSMNCSAALAFVTSIVVYLRSFAATVSTSTATGASASLMSQV